MKYKILGASAILGVLLLTTAIADTKNINFRVEIQTDTTISIPTLCETEESTVEGYLEFKPGITTLDDNRAIAIDTCADSVIGDWNVTNEGNVLVNLTFKLDQNMPFGVTVALLNENGSPDYTDGTYIELTETSDSILPLWAQNIDKFSTLPLYQRVAANASAPGDTSYDRQIIVSSSYTP